MRYVISVWGFRTAQVKFGLRPVPFFKQQHYLWASSVTRLLQLTDLILARGAVPDS